MGFMNQLKVANLSNAMTRLGGALGLTRSKGGPSAICSGRPLVGLTRSKSPVLGINSGRPAIVPQETSLLETGRPNGDRYAFSEALFRPSDVNLNKAVLVSEIQGGRSFYMSTNIMNRYGFSTSLFLSSWVSRTFASIRDSILNMIGWPKQ